MDALPLQVTVIPLLVKSTFWSDTRKPVGMLNPLLVRRVVLAAPTAAGDHDDERDEHENAAMPQMLYQRRWYLHPGRL